MGVSLLKLSHSIRVLLLLFPTSLIFCSAAPVPPCAFCPLYTQGILMYKTILLT